MRKILFLIPFFREFLLWKVPVWLQLTCCLISEKFSRVWGWIRSVMYWLLCSRGVCSCVMEVILGSSEVIALSAYALGPSSIPARDELFRILKIIIQIIRTFHLPPSDNISSFPLFYIEVLTLVFLCAYRTTVIKCTSISLGKYWDILSLLIWDKRWY